MAQEPTSTPTSTLTSTPTTTPTTISPKGLKGQKLDLACMKTAVEKKEDALKTAREKPKDYEKYECLKTLKGHNNHVESVFVIQDGKIVSGSNDDTIKI